MNAATIIVLLLVLTGMVLSLRSMLSRRAKKSCGCGGCSSDCRGCDKRKF